MNPSDHIAALEHEGHLLLKTAEHTDLDAAIPGCPGWVLRDLLRHVGSVHRWATGYVAEALTVPTESIEDRGGPWPEDAELLGWYRSGLNALVRALREADPELKCWTFLQAPSPLAHWARRQTHETAIHRADVESVSGVITPFPPALAADGIDELLVCFLTRPGGRLRSPAPRTLRFEAHDAGRAWSVCIGPGDLQVTDERADIDCAVCGNASDLYLLLWNRGAPDRLEVTGDRSLLQLWQELARIRWS